MTSTQAVGTRGNVVGCITVCRLICFLAGTFVCLIINVYKQAQAGQPITGCISHSLRIASKTPNLILKKITSTIKTTACISPTYALELRTTKSKQKTYSTNDLHQRTRTEEGNVTSHAQLNLTLMSQNENKTGQETCSFVLLFKFLPYSGEYISYSCLSFKCNTDSQDIISIRSFMRLLLECTGLSVFHNSIQFGNIGVKSMCPVNHMGG